jgi:hypothetical protein
MITVMITAVAMVMTRISFSMSFLGGSSGRVSSAAAGCSSSCFPQLVQNFAPSSISALQYGHFISTSEKGYRCRHPSYNQ